MEWLQDFSLAINSVCSGVNQPIKVIGFGTQPSEGSYLIANKKPLTN